MAAIAVCRECRTQHSKEEMIPFGPGWICAPCKPLFLQRLQEGATSRVTTRYAGFWIRAAAKTIDAVLLGAFGLVLGRCVEALLGPPITPGVMFLTLFINLTLGQGANAAFDTWFVGKHGATPGKMALGLTVVTSRHERVTYLRAFGRHCASILSTLTCYIGYLLVVFDDEKRALHDRICDTRVVYK
jgi:uncharacterized RDD family membrane protein YckC